MIINFEEYGSDKIVTIESRVIESVLDEDSKTLKTEALMDKFFQRSRFQMADYDVGHMAPELQRHVDFMEREFSEKYSCHYDLSQFLSDDYSIFVRPEGVSYRRVDSTWEEGVSILAKDVDDELNLVSMAWKKTVGESLEIVYVLQENLSQTNRELIIAVPYHEMMLTHQPNDSSGFDPNYFSESRTLDWWINSLYFEKTPKQDEMSKFLGRTETIDTDVYYHRKAEDYVDTLVVGKKDLEKGYLELESRILKIEDWGFSVVALSRRKFKIDFYNPATIMPKLREQIGQLDDLYASFGLNRNSMFDDFLTLDVKNEDPDFDN